MGDTLNCGGLLTAAASLVVECRLQACRLQQLQCEDSAGAAHGLYSVGSVVTVHRLSCSKARGTFPNWGLNPSPSIHWQMDS